MGQWGLIAAALLLAGCVTVPGGSADAQLGRLTGEAIAGVRAVAVAVEAGEAAGFAPDFATARAAVERARGAAVAEAIGARPEALAGYAALGVTLGLCREGLERVELRLEADPGAGAALAGALRLGCVAPLVLLASG